MAKATNYLCGVAPRMVMGSVEVMEAVMSRINSWSRSLSRVELDQRSREARLQLQQLERLLVSHVAARRYRRQRLLSFTAGRYMRLLQERRVRRPLNRQRPSRMPIARFARGSVPALAAATALQQ